MPDVPDGLKPTDPGDGGTKTAVQRPLRRPTASFSFTTGDPIWLYQRTADEPDGSRQGRAVYYITHDVGGLTYGLDGTNVRQFVPWAMVAGFHDRLPVGGAR